MHYKVGIRREDLSKKGEKRVSITPNEVRTLTEKGISVLVQPAIHPETRELKRAFSDEEYVNAGAVIQEDLSAAEVIYGLKEIEIDKIEPGKTYSIFSHTHKRQVKNQKLLRKFADLKCTLFDYELIANENGRLLTAFTYFAGYAGMVDSLWAYGKKIREHGHAHPFEGVPQSIEKEDLGLIKGMIREIGQNILSQGTPAELPPMITVILGDGKTSQGAQSIYDILPVVEITPEQLQSTFETGSRNKVYKLVLDIQDMFRLNPLGLEKVADYKKLSSDDQKQLYFTHPEYFEGNLEQILPYCSILMNCILWGPEYPRTFTNALAKTMWTLHQRPKMIGDITCDPNGSIEFSKETWIDAPAFTYDPVENAFIEGFSTQGISVMAVTNLPCEFSRDASAQFASELAPLLPQLLKGNLSGSFEASGLPAELKSACILWKGKLTPHFADLEDFLG